MSHQVLCGGDLSVKKPSGLILYEFEQVKITMDTLPTN